MRKKEVNDGLQDVKDGLQRLMNAVYDDQTDSEEENKTTNKTIVHCVTHSGAIRKYACTMIQECIHSQMESFEARMQARFEHRMESFEANVATKVDKLEQAITSLRKNSENQFKTIQSRIDNDEDSE